MMSKTQNNEYKQLDDLVAKLENDLDEKYDEIREAVSAIPIPSLLSRDEAIFILGCSQFDGDGFVLCTKKDAIVPNICYPEEKIYLRLYIIDDYSPHWHDKWESNIKFNFSIGWTSRASYLGQGDIYHGRTNNRSIQPISPDQRLFNKDICEQWYLPLLDKLRGLGYNIENESVKWIDNKSDLKSMVTQTFSIVKSCAEYDAVRGEIEELIARGYSLDEYF